MKSPPAIGFDYRASPFLVAVTAGVALLALVAAWLVRGPLWLHVLLTSVVVAYAAIAIRRLLHPPIASLLWRNDGGVELRVRKRTDAGDEALGAVRGARVLGPLIVLTLRWPPREHATIWLLPDNLDADCRRRLRMRLGASAASLTSGNADTG